MTNPIKLPPPLAPHQELAAVNLAIEARDAVDAGHEIPCRRDPADWDRRAQPGDCDGCPVLEACDRYRLTGAVRHRTVLAGCRVDGPEKKRPRRRSRAAPAHRPATTRAA